MIGHLAGPVWGDDWKISQMADRGIDAKALSDESLAALSFMAKARRPVSLDEIVNESGASGKTIHDLERSGHIEIGQGARGRYTLTNVGQRVVSAYDEEKAIKYLNPNLVKPGVGVDADINNTGRNIRHGGIVVSGDGSRGDKVFRVNFDGQMSLVAMDEIIAIFDPKNPPRYRDDFEKSTEAIKAVAIAIAKKTVRELQSMKAVQDQVGKFWVVTKPTRVSTSGDILFQTDVFGFARQLQGGLSEGEIALITHDAQAAKRLADSLLQR